MKGSCLGDRYRPVASAKAAFGLKRSVRRVLMESGANQFMDVLHAYGYSLRLPNTA